MLLPALGKVKEQGKRVKCTSNIKQIGLAISLYSNDFDDYIMPSQPTFDGSGSDTWVQGLVIWGYLSRDNFKGNLGKIYKISTTEPAGVFVCPSASGKLEGNDTKLNNTAATTHYGLGTKVGQWSSVTESTAEDVKKSYAKKIHQYGKYVSKVMVLGEKRWGPTNSYRLTPLTGSGQVFDGMLRHNAYGNFLFFDYHMEGRKPAQVPCHVTGPVSGYPATLANVTKTWESAFWGNLNYIDMWPGSL